MPGLPRQLVRREVTRIVTPGTTADSSLGSDENNFLAAIAQVGDRVGFAALDLSTGEFRATEFSGDGALRRVQEELEQLRPKELLYGSAAPLFESAGTRGSAQPSFAGSESRGILRTAASPQRSGCWRKPPPRLRWMTGSSRPTMRFRCLKIILAFCRWKDLGWQGARRPHPRRVQFCTTCDRRNEDLLITSIALAGMSGKTAWCSTR